MTALLVHRRRTARSQCAALLLLLLCLPAQAIAAGTTPPKGEATPLNLGESEPAQSAASGGGLARTIVGLAVVIAVIYGVTWVLRQMKAAQEQQSTGAGGLADAAALGLGTGRAVHLVRAGNEFLLLGVTDGGIQPLRTYTEEEARRAGLPVDEIDEVQPLRPAAREGARGPLVMVEQLRKLTVRQ